MRIWRCLCFGEEKDNKKGYKSMKDTILGIKGEESPDDSPAFDCRRVFDGVGVAAALTPQVEAAGNVGVRRNEKIDFDIKWLSSEVEVRNENYSGDRMLNVNLNLGLSGEASSSTVQKEDSDRDTHSKRPKVNAFSLDWDNHLLQETNLFCPMNEGGGDVSLSNLFGASNDEGRDIKMEDLDMRMDLTDDLLHMVFSFLDHIDLCRAASVCRQWRAASSHEDFWRYLNFENKHISSNQFEDMCQRYPNATAVNLYGALNIHPLAMKVVSSLRNLDALTLGRGQLGETFFQALTDCHVLKSLIINDATLGNGIQEIPIYHDRLHLLQLVKCRVLRVSIRCPQLETLSLKRSSMPHAVLNCPLLHDLDIASCHKLSDAAIRSAATACPLLESLDMSNCSCVSDETLREIAQTCGNLRVLDASYCPNISLESVRLVMLTVLKLHSCEGITSASMAAIAHSYMLEVLELDNCSLLTSVSLDLPRLQNIRLVHCRKFIDFNLHCGMLSSITVSNCPLLQRINLTSGALKKLVLQKQESLATIALQCPNLLEVDLTECESLTNSICEVFSDGGGCPMLKSLVLDSCEVGNFSYLLLTCAFLVVK